MTVVDLILAKCQDLIKYDDVVKRAQYKHCNQYYTCNVCLGFFPRKPSCEEI